MSVQKPVLTPPHGGETVTSSGGSSVEMKVESSQSGGEYGAVMWTLRAGEEPPLHTHSREDELLFGLYHVHKIWAWPSMIASSFGIAWATRRFRSFWMGVIVHGLEGFFIVLVVAVLAGWYP